LIAYLLNGLLGVSQEDLFFDYLFSNFGSIGSSRSLDNINDQYVTYIDSLPGKDLSEHIEYFLASIGVKEIVINRVRENMAA
jgi:hypothetical protein